MLVTFLKHHVKWREGEEVDLPEETALYLIRCRVVTVRTGEKDVEDILNKKLKSAKKKK